MAGSPKKRARRLAEQYYETVVTNQEKVIEWTELNPRQAEFLKAVDDPTIRDVAYIAGRGSGKTKVLSRAILEKMYQYPGIRCALTAHSHDKLRDSTKRVFMDMVEQSGRPYVMHEKSNIFELPNKAECWFRSYEMKSPFRGPEIAIIGMDEARETEEQDFVVSSASLRQPGYPHKFLVATTPNGKNHWTSKYFINEDTRLPGSVCVRGSSYDNIGNLPPDYLPRLEGIYKGAFREQELMGRVVSPQGLVFDQFSRERNIIPAVGAAAYEQIYEGHDFGATTAHPEAHVWVKIDTKGRLVVFDEYKMGGMATEQHAMNIKAKAHNGIAIFSDPSGAQGRINYGVYGLFLQPCQRRSPKGVEDVFRGMQWKRQMYVYLNALLYSGKLLITDNCVELISEIESFMWKDTGEIIDDGARFKYGSDKTEKKHDDIIDALQYVAAMIPVDIMASEAPLSVAERARLQSTQFMQDIRRNWRNSAPPMEYFEIIQENENAFWGRT